jgi:hypothetical protein
MQQIEIINYKNRENTLYYNFEKKIYINTYDIFTLKEVLNLIITENNEDTFIDINNLYLSIIDLQKKEVE